MARLTLRGSLPTKLSLPAREAAACAPAVPRLAPLRRSRAYLDAVIRLDAGRHVQDGRTLEALISAIAKEFPELAIEQRPLAIVCRCDLGAPYIVHICDLDGRIIEHYETYRAMPPAFEPARAPALNPAYAFVEVCDSEMRAIAIDGAVVVFGRR